MRRHLILAAVALAACAKTDQPADTVAAAAPPPPPPQVTLADFAGTWDIKTMPMDKDTVLTSAVLTATGTMDGWSMTIGSSKTRIPVTVVSVGGDSVVTTAAGFPSAVRRGQRVTGIHTITHLQGGKMVGVNHAKYANGDSATFRLDGTKRASTP